MILNLVLYVLITFNIQCSTSEEAREIIVDREIVGDENSGG